ncbi:MAG: hypothetical protein DDT19_01957 [Syntrophomonadaceae bacterium]|nr:hypothetical protein [Bacillota bacterium]
MPFVYSSNGHLFVEYDHFTGKTSEPRSLKEFPTPEELQERYEKEVGFSLQSEAAKPLLVPYPGGEANRRYYQDAAIRAALEEIAKGEKRLLLFLATGSGKTFIFCIRDTHADAVAIGMNNLYADWCVKNRQQRLEPYVFKCTAAVGGSQYIADLRGSERSHFIATTVDLITTGVDVPILRNVVFFKYVCSFIAFQKEYLRCNHDMDTLPLAP